MKKKIEIIVSVMCFLLSALFFKASAQDCGCDGALAKDRIENSKEDFEQLYHLSQLENDEYEELKKSYDGNFKYKQVLKGSANLSDFRKRITSEIRKVELETNSHYKSTYYESRTNPIAYEAWTRCMELRCGKGLFLWIRDEDENTIALKLMYNPPPNSGKINFTLEINHVDGSSESKANIIGLNETKTLFIKRRCGSKNGDTKTFISVSGGGYSPDITSKYYCGTRPVPPPIPIQKPKPCGGTNFDKCTGMWVCSSKPLPEGCVINDVKTCSTCECEYQWFIKNIGDMPTGSEGWVCYSITQPLPPGWIEIPDSKKDCSCCPSDGSGSQIRIRKQ